MTASTTQPWYRHGWLWFVIAVPMSAVVAGVATLFIAIENGPERVPQVVVQTQQAEGHGQ